MATHINLLGILYLICGGLSVLVGLALVALGVGTAAIAAAASPGSGFTAHITASAFFAIAFVAFVWGAVSVCAGAALRRYRPRARLTVLVLAFLSLFLVPFGTALGVYTFWVLLGDQARRLFEVA